MNEIKAINKRFADIRKALKKSQEEYGTILGISKSGVSDIERGRRDVNEKHIKFLLNWKEYHISELYLREGIGEMFKTPDDKLSEVLADVLMGEDKFIQNFVKKYMSLSESSKVIVRHMFTEEEHNNAKKEEISIEDLYTKMPTEPEESDKHYSPVDMEDDVG